MLFLKHSKSILASENTCFPLHSLMFDNGRSFTLFMSLQKCLSPSRERFSLLPQLNSMISVKAKIYTKVKQARKTLFKDIGIGKKGHKGIWI